MLTKVLFKPVGLLLFAWLLAFNVQAYEVVDSFGKHQFTSPPKRVVVTDWTLLEQLLVLGVSPVGAPELAQYQSQVGHPKLPISIVDIGLRRAPSIEAIRALKPDLILLGTDQKDFERPFSRIARVMYYQNFSERFSSNGEKAQTRLRELATLFQKQAQAEAALKQINQSLAKLRQHLTTFYKGELPKVTVVRIVANNKVVLYGEHSLVGYALAALNLSSELPFEKNKLGEKRLSLAELQKIQEGVLLYSYDSQTSNDNQSSNDSQNNPLLKNKHWAKLPVVKAGNAIEIAPVWPYGGAMSQVYYAKAIANALTSKIQ